MASHRVKLDLHVESLEQWRRRPAKNSGKACGPAKYSLFLPPPLLLSYDELTEGELTKTRERKNLLRCA